MQRQKDRRTIQGEIEKALELLYGFKTTINYAGRTDAGVHALGQVIDFSIHDKLKKDTIQNALNAILPHDIRVLKVELADDNFHSRYSCFFRDYVYIIDTAEVCMPFYRNFVWHLPKLNVNMVLRKKNIFEGFHNFENFSKKPTGVRAKLIKYIRIRQKGSFILFFIRGNSFLRGMVRFIVGAIVSMCKELVSVENINSAFNGHHVALIKAPAKGLYFKRALY